MRSLGLNKIIEIATISTASAVFGYFIYELFKIKEKEKTSEREKSISFATAFLSATLIQILVIKSKK
jgi:hypothetical protein